MNALTDRSTQDEITAILKTIGRVQGLDVSTARVEVYPKYVENIEEMKKAIVNVMFLAMSSSESAKKYLNKTEEQKEEIVRLFISPPILFISQTKQTIYI